MEALVQCRGVLVAGVTNCARTQMAEAWLRHLSEGLLPVQSGGVHLGTGRIHPLAEEVMAEAGVSLTSHSVHTLEAARRQRATYDVLISIDDPHGPWDHDHRRADRYQQLERVKQAKARQHRALYKAHQHLYPSTPSHWSIGLDATDARARTDLWSPADPMIAHETSTRRFQDHLYEGEPLFSRLELNTMRREVRLSERWVVEALHVAYAAEREGEHKRRFVVARDELRRHCERLIQRLRVFYGVDALKMREDNKNKI